MSTVSDETLLAELKAGKRRGKGGLHADCPLIVESDVRRKTRTGRSAACYALTDAGRAVLASLEAPE